MIKENKILNNEFQHYDNNNISYKIKDNNDNHDRPKINEITLSNNPENVILKRKIESITQYLKPYVSKILYGVLQINQNNIKIICDFIIAEQNEIKVKKLVHLFRYFHHKKTFFEMTKEDILDYLDSLRKPSTLDPTHKSIGT